MVLLDSTGLHAIVAKADNAGTFWSHAAVLEHIVGTGFVILFYLIQVNLPYYLRVFVYSRLVLGQIRKITYFGVQYLFVDNELEYFLHLNQLVDLS